MPKLNLTTDQLKWMRARLNLSGNHPIVQEINRALAAAPEDDLTLTAEESATVRALLEDGLPKASAALRAALARKR